MRRFITTALPVLLLALPAGAMAQDGIVKLPAPPPLSSTTNNKQTAATKQAPVPTDTELEEQGIVVPPALFVVKKNPDLIVIPTGDATKNSSEAKDESKYTERPASSVQVSSDFGYRRDPFTRRAKFHSGLDIKAKWGDPVGASHAGVVQFAGWYSGYGNLVIIDHGSGITTYYAHLSSFELQVGDKVSRGGIVGYAGRTGRATSPHLHYEVRFEGKAVNPLAALTLDPESAFFAQTRTSEKATSDKITTQTTTPENKK